MGLLSRVVRPRQVTSSVAAPKPATAGATSPAGGLSLRRLANAGREEELPEPSARAASAQARPAKSIGEVSGRVVREIYSSGDYAVYAVETPDGEVTVAGTSGIKAAKGDRIIARGSWGTYKGRPTFRAAMLMHEIPKGARGVVTWLVQTKAVPGVGKTTAEKLARHFGDSLPDLIGKAEELVKAGIGQAKAEAIAEAWNINANQPELIEFLGRHGLGQMTIAKVVRRFGGAARRVVKENPWALAEHIDGIGFRTADSIAIQVGLRMDCVERIRAGLRFTLNQKTALEGHCGLPKELLIEEACSLLGLQEVAVKGAFENFLNECPVTFDEETGLIYPNGLFFAERRLARRLTSMMKTGKSVPYEVARQAIEDAFAEMSVARDELQVQAAIMALTSPLSIITGGPGTGKSTIQRAIVKALEKLGKNVSLAAPTGRAAKRLSEVTGHEAGTCHRLLGFSESGEFTYDEDNPFKQDHFIIDEFSMLDVRMAEYFMSAVKPEGCVTIVGDVDQLPSVGSGQVLRDLIESGAVPVSRLTKVHRQEGDSGIVVAAARINSGQHPKPDPMEDIDGFVLDSVNDAVTMRKRIVQLMCEELPAQGFDPIKDVQVLAPMRKGDVGVLALNEAIKKALNPATAEQSVELKNRVFSIGDRVVHLRNDYERNVFNGELGTVTWVGRRKNGEGKEEQAFKVDYSGHGVTYDISNVDDVELSWAATVHKSQGCEFPVVIFVCPMAHRRMLTRNLLYTAVTRAKKKCIVIGSEEALRLAIDTVDVNRRFTGLSLRMQERKPSPAP